MPRRLKPPFDRLVQLLREPFLILTFAVVSVLTAAGCGSGGATLSQSPPPGPQFTDFDAPGAGQTSPQGTYATTINGNGDVVGYVIDSTSTDHGFIRSSSGSITTVDAPGAGTQNFLGTSLWDINSSGESVGYLVNSQGGVHTVLRSSSGVITMLDPPGAFDSGAYCINDNGDIAGGFTDASGYHGFVRTANGNFTAFDPTGDPSQVQKVIPYRITSAGAVAGDVIDQSGVHHGFFMDSTGAITILDAPGAGTSSGEGTEVADMNSSGVIVGGINIGVVNGVNTTHSFIRAAGGAYTIFDPPQANGLTSFAEGVNDSGAVVGTFRDSSLVRQSYLRQADGTFVTFNDPDAAQLPFSSTNLGTVAYRINASGVVTGLFSDSAGVRHGFVWR
jgi:uncharacterized membrane protein